MTSKFVIREAVPEDAEAVIAYCDTVAGETNNITRGAGEFSQVISLEDEKKLLGDTLKNPRSVFFTCWDVSDGVPKLIGVSNVLVRADRSRFAHKAEFGVSLLKAYWGQGLGGKLFDAAISYARQSPQTRILELIVRADNERAIRLYASRGFEVTGTLRGYMQIEGRLIDAFAMSRLV